MAISKFICIFKISLRNSIHIVNICNIDVSSDTKNLNYKYKLEDENSKVVVDGDKDLKFGENHIAKTLAEAGTEVKYELKVNKYTKTDEALSSGLGFATMGCAGYGAYCFAKKRQKR